MLYFSIKIIFGSKHTVTLTSESESECDEQPRKKRKLTLEVMNSIFYSHCMILVLKYVFNNFNEKHKYICNLLNIVHVIFVVFN